MNKATKIVLIIAACFLGLGLLVSGIGLAWSVSVANRLTPETPVAQSIPIDAAALRSLDLAAGTGSITLVRIDDPAQARLTLTGYAQDELTVTQEDGLLLVRTDDFLGGSSILNLGFFRVDWLGRIHVGSLAPRTVTLYLPSMQLDAVSLDSGTGSITGDLPFTARTLSLSCGTGSIDLAELYADDMKLSAGTGSVLVDSLACKTLDIRVGTGKIDISSGRVDERAALSSGTGEISFSGLLHGTSFIESGTGKIHLFFADSAENYAVTVRKDTGDINVTNAVLDRDDDGGSINAGSGAANTVQVNGNVGDITLTFAPAA